MKLCKYSVWKTFVFSFTNLSKNVLKTVRPSVYLSICLPIYLSQRQRDGEMVLGLGRDRFLVHWFTFQVQHFGAETGWSEELSLGSPHGWQGSRHVEYHLVPPRHISRKLCQKQRQVHGFFSLLVCSPGCNSLGWARMKPGARVFWARCVGVGGRGQSIGTIFCLPRYIRRDLGQKWSQQDMTWFSYGMLMS